MPKYAKCLECEHYMNSDLHCRYCKKVTNDNVIESSRVMGMGRKAEDLFVAGFKKKRKKADSDPW